MNRLLPRLLLTPAMATLFLWMIVPLVMTIYFSLIRYNLMQPDQSGFAGLENFEYFVTDPSFSTAVLNTVWLLGSVILITVVVGIAIALLINDPFPGRAKEHPHLRQHAVDGVHHHVLPHQRIHRGHDEERRD